MERFSYYLTRFNIQINAKLLNMLQHYVSPFSFTLVFAQVSTPKIYRQQSKKLRSDSRLCDFAEYYVLNNGFDDPYASIIAPVTAEAFELIRNKQRAAISPGSIIFPS